MLGKRSGSLLRTTSSRSLILPCEDSDGDRAAISSMREIEKHPAHPLCDPCKIVIGFDLGGADTKPPYVCSSPRSVLDQQLAEQSPRSCLSNLLSRKVDSGDVARFAPQGIIVGKDGRTLHCRRLHCMESCCGQTKGILRDRMRHQLGDIKSQQFLPTMSDEYKEITVQHPILYAASPPSVCETATIGFLNKCALCGGGLHLGKDVFMYRGDQAFCSAECRDRKIAIDLLKRRQGRKCGVVNPPKRTLPDPRVRGFA